MEAYPQFRMQAASSLQATAPESTQNEDSPHEHQQQHRFTEQKSGT
jgi:hypothetical protein